MTTNQLGIRNSNIIVPYTAATKRTKWISVTDAGHIVLSGANISNSAINRAAVMAYADSLGNWHLRFNIRLTCTSAGVRTSATVTFASTYAVVFKNTAGFFQDVGVSCTTLISILASTDPNAATISISHASSSEASYKLSGDVELNAEPTWAAANMEGALPVDVYIPHVSSGVAGIFPALNTELDDATATRLGLKQYVHGTTYNGGNAPTVTMFAGIGTLSSIPSSSFIPYQLQDGSWKIRMSVYAIFSSAVRTVTQFSINGMTFGATEAGFGFISSTVALMIYTAVSDSKIYCDHASAATTQYAFSGDFKLASKPTWAY